jgi:cysteine desulfurase/selenocysteine lyase
MQNPKTQTNSANYYFLSNHAPMIRPKKPNKSFSNNIDILSIRNDFPILQKKVNGKPLIWLDNAATTQKPKSVIHTLNQYYHEYNSNIHRGAHTLATLATDAYESARKKVQTFIGASSTEEIIFVRGATEAINLVAQTYGKKNIHTGDEILLSTMEHHSNIVPWQILQEETGAVIKVIPINDHGEIILEEYEKMLSPRTRFVAITHVSNVLGTINPISTMIKMAHDHGACVLIDGAQAVPHLSVNVKDLDADFYALSGHKAYGPTGIGVLYGKKAILEKMPPWQTGGGMIKNVSFSETIYNNLPYKFEAGTGNIADAIGLGAAIDYMKKIGLENIERHEKELTAYAMEALSTIPGLDIIGTAPTKTSVISFIINGIVPEVATHNLSQEGIALRVGHHCAQPAMQRFHVTSTIRASLGMYNTVEEIDILVKALSKIAKSYH